MTHTTASLTANCFNKLYLLHFTTGKLLKNRVSSEHIKNYARTPVREFKSRRHLSILDEQKDDEPQQGPREVADSTEEPSLMMQDVVLLSTKVHPFMKNWDQVGKG